MAYQSYMPMTEKEYNGNLLDQLTLLERIEVEALKDQAANVLKIISFEKGAPILNPIISFTPSFLFLIPNFSVFL